MPLIYAFLTQSATVEPYLRFGGGKMIYGPPETRPCRAEAAPNTKIVYKNPSGSIVETVASLLLFTIGEEIPVNSRVTVEGREMRVVKCEGMRGFGPSHLEVYLE